MKQKINPPVHQMVVNVDELWPKPIPAKFWDTWLTYIRPQPLRVLRIIKRIDVCHVS